MFRRVCPFALKLADIKVENMKIGYAILAHKNWDQLATLIRHIKEDWNQIFVHVDAKADWNEARFRRENPDVDCRFLVRRVPVYWGHSSQIDAEVELLRAISTCGEKVDRVVLISGQDLPIVSNESIIKFFRTHPDSEFLEFRKLPVRWWPYGGMDRVMVYNLPDILGRRGNQVLRAAQMMLPFRRKAIPGYPFFGCSQWVNITGNAVSYILELLESMPILERFRYTYCADEMFFQTLLMNSPFASKCVNNNLRFMKWPKGVSGPDILRRTDIDMISASTETCLFARKFDSTVDSDVIEMILRQGGARL